jgi:hypothetical protein
MNKEILLAISALSVVAGGMEMVLGFGGSEVGATIGLLGVLTLIAGSVGMVGHYE